MASALLLFSIGLGILAAVWLALIILLARQSNPQGRGETSYQFALPHTPNHATGFEIAYLIFRAASKHVLSTFGLVPRLQIDTAHGRGQNFKLPFITTQGVLHFNQDDERQFGIAVGGKDFDQTISPFFLISLTLPLMIHLLTDPACPILPLGTVNTRNVFTIAQPTLVRDITFLRKASNESRLSYRAAFGGHDQPGHRRKRGMEFCITLTVLLDGTAILIQELWILQFLPASRQPKFVPVGHEDFDKQLDNDTHESVYSRPLRMSTKDPRLWARGSKDYNPIHISSLGARLFGFKSVIAHGNHVVALAMDSLRSEDMAEQSTSALNARFVFWESTKSLRLDIRFIRPLTLPAETQISWINADKQGRGEKISISRRGKVHIAGNLYQDK